MGKSKFLLSTWRDYSVGTVVAGRRVLEVTAVAWVSLLIVGVILCTVALHVLPCSRLAKLCCES